MVLHVFAAYGTTPLRIALAVAAVAAMSSMTCMFDVSDNRGQAHALRSVIVGVARALRVSCWWVTALALRVGRAFVSKRQAIERRDQASATAQEAALMNASSSRRKAEVSYTLSH
jgi:hypothetical protein